MGAFDGELYALGYRFNNGSNPTKPKKPTKKEIWLENLHTPKMPCPGSCGEACTNHFCSAHNGTSYVQQPPRYTWVNKVKQDAKDKEIRGIELKITKLKQRLITLQSN